MSCTPPRGPSLPGPPACKLPLNSSPSCCPSHMPTLHKMRLGLTPEEGAGHSHARCWGLAGTGRGSGSPGPWTRLSALPCLPLSLSLYICEMEATQSPGHGQGQGRGHRCSTSTQPTHWKVGEPHTVTPHCHLGVS